MKRQLSSRFQPRLEALEERCTPSAVQVPFKETLTLTGLEGAVASYEGTATHLGKVSAVEHFNTAFDPSDPSSVFATYVKTVANGDTLFGRIIPDDPALPFTTGKVTIDGGTGRLDGAAGLSDYLVSSNAKTGAIDVAITGLISYGPAAQKSATQVLPFKVTGGGPAPQGVPLFPGGTVTHSATGVATHLGKYTGEGTFELGSLDISPTGAVTGTFRGSFVFVAANGDRLAFTYGDGFTAVVTGQLSADLTAVVNVQFDAVFTPDPANSTGRFAKVTGGSFRMIATVDYVSLISSMPGFTAPFDYTWNGEGVLQVGKLKK